MENKNCFRKLVTTDTKDYALLILRVVLWVFMFTYWTQKMFWRFWWNWYEATIWFFATLWVPYFLAFLVMLWESLWAFLLILWVFTRVMAWSIAIIMVWAIVLVHFKNWYFDYDSLLLVIAMAVALVIRWWWAWSVDGLFIKK